MLSAVKSGQKIKYKLVESSEGEGIFDGFVSDRVFMSDLRKASPRLRSAMIAQFTAERFSVDNYEKADREKISNSPNFYSTTHKKRKRCICLSNK